MLASILAMAFVLDSQASPDPATLVDQLGSNWYALRILAEGELARLGRSALPALRAARNSKDAEIRARSVALVSRIEDSLLLQATPIRLDFHDVPLTEAVEAIGRQAGSRISLVAEERSVLAGRRIDLRSNATSSFWNAIDKLCAAGNLHPVLGNRASSGPFDGSLLLQDGPVAGTRPVSDSGPFRVQLSSLHYQSEVQLDQIRPIRTGGMQGDDGLDSSSPPVSPNREFFLQLVLSAEPRLSVTGNGAVRLTEAVDERGRTLLAPAGPGHFRHSAGYHGLNPSSMLRFRVDLDYPDPPAKRIKIVKGSIPVIVATRRPDLMVVPLATGRGRSYRCDEAALTVIDLRPASIHQPATMQVAIKALGALVESPNPGIGEPLGYRPDSFQQQIEILDAQGRSIPWFPSSTHYDGEEARLTMTFGPPGTSAVPATLRYHGLHKANADIPFEFRDIPMP